jgi:hypothetical protein
MPADWVDGRVALWNDKQLNGAWLHESGRVISRMGYGKPPRWAPCCV